MVDLSMPDQPRMLRNLGIGTALETRKPLQKQNLGFLPVILGGHRWIHPKTPEFRSRGCMNFFWSEYYTLEVNRYRRCMRMYIIYWSVYNFGPPINSVLCRACHSEHTAISPLFLDSKGNI
jgi:predicted CXXCH cytochrome family protein